MRRDSHEHYVAEQAPDWSHKAQQFKPLVQIAPSDVFDLREYVEAMNQKIEDTKAMYFARGVIATLASCTAVLLLIAGLAWTLRS